MDQIINDPPFFIMGGNEAHPINLERVDVFYFTVTLKLSLCDLWVHSCNLDKMRADLRNVPLNSPNHFQILKGSAVVWKIRIFRKHFFGVTKYL